MIQPFINSQFYLESALLRSCVYRFRFNDCQIISVRNAHKKMPPRDNKNHGRLFDDEKNSQSMLNSSWHEFHFPSSKSLFKSDMVNSDEWSLVYRIKWSLKVMYLVVYGHAVALIGSVVVLYNVLVKGKQFHNSNITNQSYLKAGITLCCLMVFSFSILLIKSFRKAVLRGYYSPKYQRFMFIRPTLLTPWKVHKLIVAPGMVEPIQSENFSLFHPNCKIKDTKLYIFEKNFYFPSYYNVLYGFTSANHVSGLTYDPDEVFMYQLKDG